MSPNGYLDVLVSPFVSLWNAFCFVFVTLLWSNLFGRKKERIWSKRARYSNIPADMASRSPRDGRRPCKTQSSLDEGDDGLPRDIANLRAYHKQAYGYIAKALEIDEEGGQNYFLETFNFNRHTCTCTYSWEELCFEFMTKQYPCLYKSDSDVLIKKEHSFVLDSSVHCSETWIV